MVDLHLHYIGITTLLLKKVAGYDGLRFRSNHVDHLSTPQCTRKDPSKSIKLLCGGLLIQAHLIDTLWWNGDHFGYEDHKWTILFTGLNGVLQFLVLSVQLLLTLLVELILGYELVDLLAQHHKSILLCILWTGYDINDGR